MSVQAISWVLDHSKSQGATRCVLMSIANHVGVDGEGWVYVAQVMKEANCSLDTYRRAVKWAVDHHELAREFNKGNATRAAENRKPNHYRLTQVGSADCPPQESCPVQPTAPRVAPPEPSLLLEPSLSLDKRTDEAFALLVERDVQKVEGKRNVRAVRRTCRSEREKDGTLGVLNDLAGKNPDWSALELADACDGMTPCEEPAKKRTDIWCGECGHTGDHWPEDHDLAFGVAS